MPGRVSRNAGRAPAATATGATRAGRRLGVTAQVGVAEMLLRVKTPGECGIAPAVPAGRFSPDLAIRLIDGT